MTHIPVQPTMQLLLFSKVSDAEFRKSAKVQKRKSVIGQGRQSCPVSVVLRRLAFAIVYRKDTAESSFADIPLAGKSLHKRRNSLKLIKHNGVSGNCGIKRSLYQMART